MTSGEMVTNFVIRRDHWTIPDGRDFGYCDQARERWASFTLIRARMKTRQRWASRIGSK